MKKLFFSIVIFTLLTACQTASKETTCDGFTYETWNNLSYALPACWTATDVLDKTGAATLLRLDHDEGILSLDITVTPNQGDPSPMWGPPESQYGEYYYYDLLIDDTTSEFMRFENGTKISIVTQNPVPESAQQNLYDILSSLSITQ